MLQQLPSGHALPSDVTLLRMILRVPIEEPAAPEFVSGKLAAVVCVLARATVSLEVNVCWALAPTGSSRVTNARANRLNFRPAGRRTMAETDRSETMATSHAE